MVELRFFGHSDDCAEFEASDGEAEETYLDEDGVATFRVGTAMFVVLRYEHNGCWSVAPMQIEEETPLPLWPMRIEQYKNGYSPVLIVEAPDGVEVSVEES